MAKNLATSLYNTGTYKSIPYLSRTPAQAMWYNVQLSLREMPLPLYCLVSVIGNIFNASRENRGSRTRFHCLDFHFSDLGH